MHRRLPGETIAHIVSNATLRQSPLHYLTDSTCWIDLLFSDIRVPGSMNGLALAQAAQHGRPGLPVILTTGFASELLDNPTPQVVDILLKPYTPDQLLTAIRTALAQVSSGMPWRKGDPEECA